MDVANRLTPRDSPEAPCLPRIALRNAARQGAADEPEHDVADPDRRAVSSDAALTVLEAAFAGLIALDGDERRSLARMGTMSEQFCRLTLNVLVQAPQVVPPASTSPAHRPTWSRSTLPKSAPTPPGKAARDLYTHPANSNEPAPLSRLRLARIRQWQAPITASSPDASTHYTRSP